MSVPYFPLYVADYEADTAHLTLEEDGAYLRLLRLCWRTPGCSIPADPKWIARMMRVTWECYERVVAPIINEFLTHKNNRYFSPRLQREMERINATSKARSDAGKLGNEKRWEKEGASDKPLKTNKTGDRPAIAKVSHPEPEPELEKQTPLPPKGGEFELFWKAYPKRVAEAAARRYWASLSAKDRQAAIDGIAGYQFAADPKFIPNPSTWISQRRWEDATSTAKPEADQDALAEFYAGLINGNEYLHPRTISQHMRYLIITRGLATRERVRERLGD